MNILDNNNGEEIDTEYYPTNMKTSYSVRKLLSFWKILKHGGGGATHKKCDLKSETLWKFVYFKKFFQRRE